MALRIYRYEFNLQDISDKCEQTYSGHFGHIVGYRGTM